MDKYCIEIVFLYDDDKYDDDIIVRYQKEMGFPESKEFVESKINVPVTEEQIKELGFGVV